MRLVRKGLLGDSSTSVDRQPMEVAKSPVPKSVSTAPNSCSLSSLQSSQVKQKAEAVTEPTYLEESIFSEKGKMCS
jgi:hypothetical protein